MTKTDFEGVICDYKDRCTDYNNKCHSCNRNTGRKSYYKPDNPPNPFPNPFPLVPFPGEPRPKCKKPTTHWQG